MDTTDSPGREVAIRTVDVDGTPVLAGSAEDVGALCTTPTRPNGIPGRTYRWYVMHRPEHQRAPSHLVDSKGHPIRDPDTGARVYSVEAVKAWHASRPGSAHAAPRPTDPNLLNATKTRRDLLEAAAADQVRRDEHDRWELRGAMPSRRVAQSLSELDSLGVFTRNGDGKVRLSDAGVKLHKRWTA